MLNTPRPCGIALVMPIQKHEVRTVPVPHNEEMSLKAVLTLAPALCLPPDSVLQGGLNGAVKTEGALLGSLSEVMLPGSVSSTVGKPCPLPAPRLNTATCPAP